MYAPSNLRRLDEKIEETVEITETHDPNGIVACIKGMMERAETKDVLAKTEKVMMVFGTEDKFIVGQTRENLISEFPDATIVVIPETGHNSFIEAPEKVAEAIEEFVGK